MILSPMAILYDVIDIDDDDDYDLVITDEKVGRSDKGKKTIEATNQDVFVIEDNDDSDDLVIIGENVDNSNKGKKTIEAVNQDGHGIDYDLSLNKSAYKNSSWYNDSQSSFKKSHVADSSQVSWSLQPSNSKIQGSTSVSSSSLQEIKLDNIYQYSYGIKESSQDVPSKKKKSAASLHDISLGLKSSNPERLSKSFCSKMKSAGLDGNLETRKPVSASKPPFSPKFTSAENASSNSPYHANFKDEIMKNFVCLQHFVPDIDFPIHLFEYNRNSKERPKNWAKKIQKEWKILEKNLPDSIFIRVYESQMDVMRAVIIGAKGTPYHDGLFFFDLYFTNSFPDVPPRLYFHHRCGFHSLHPNLEHSGDVCLSLLNTAEGNKRERWIPRVSTVLQVLVSIQGLVLTAHPLYTAYSYNFYKKSGPIKGDNSSRNYNEQAFIGSLWTMIHIIIRPPKDFEDLVKEHFRNRSHDIILACEAYMEGARVGSFGENGSQEVDLNYKYHHQKLFFEQFKNSLRESMKKLVEEFTRIWDMH